MNMHMKLSDAVSMWTFGRETPCDGFMATVRRARAEEVAVTLRETLRLQPPHEPHEPSPRRREPMSTRMAYAGTCSNPDCSAMFVVAPHPESPEDAAERIADGPDEWENFTDCWVCDSSIDWNGNEVLPMVIRD